MINMINWIKNNVSNARHEDGYGLMMDKNTNLYYLSHESIDFLLYILNNDPQDLIADISISAKYDLNQLTDNYLKIKTYIDRPKSSLSPFTEDARAQLAFTTKTLNFKAPIYTSFQVLDVCNLKCKHCYSDSKYDNSKVMSLDSAKKIIDDLSDSGVFMIGITGGETLMHPDIFEIIRYGAEKRILINMNSNGTLLTPQIAKKLKESGLNSLKISIDGKKESHNFIRGNDYAFDKSVEALTIAKEAGLDPEIYYVVFKNNLNDVDFMLDLAKSLDVKINIRRFIPMGRGSNELDLMLNANDVQYMLSKVNSRINENITIDRCYVYSSRKGNCHICNKTVSTITKNGDLFTCPYIQLKELKLGNVFEQTFKELYDTVNEHIFLNFTNENLSEPCNSCNDFDICYGGCRATAYVCNNKLPNGLDSQCEKVFLYSRHKDLKG